MKSKNSKKLLEIISLDPNILHGKPRIKGTRIGVSMVLELLAAGFSVERICSKEFYPSLKPEHVLACIAFANQFLNEEEIHFSEELKTPLNA